MSMKDLWHFKYWEKFNEIVYSMSLNSSDLIDNGELKHSDELYNIPKGGVATKYEFDHAQDHWYYKLHKDGVNYLLPSRFHEDLPIVPKKTVDMKLTRSDNKVWKFITDYERFRITPKNHGSIKQFVKEFNPLRNSNEESSTVLKAISIARGLKLGLCGDYGVGKNANYHLKASIQNNAVGAMKNTSQAMFYKLVLFNDDILIDEITTWDPQKLKLIEDNLSSYGDQSTRTNKHARDSNAKNEIMRNLSGKSIIMAFNPYVQGHHERLFGQGMNNSGKIRVRYPFIYLKGKVIDPLKEPSEGLLESTVRQNMEFYKKYAEWFLYIRENYHKMMHGYDRSRCVFHGNTRKEPNISPLLDVFDAMSDTENEFEFWVSVINKRKKDFDRMEASVNGESITINDYEKVI